MLRKAVAILAWGFVLVAVTIYVFEFVISDYEVPAVSLAKWSILVLAGALIYFSRSRDEVIYHHLPH